MTTPCVSTLLIDGEDVQLTAYITDASGILGDAPSSGDLIAQDWGDVAIWQQGPRVPWTFDVPLIMRATGDEATARLQLRHVQSWVGGQKVFTRRFPVALTTQTDQVAGVVVSAVQVEWDLSRRALLRAVLVVQALGPWVPVSGGVP